MTRSRQSAKAAGARFERQPRTGAKDKGDIAGVTTADGRPIAVECKNVTDAQPPAANGSP